MSRWKCLIPLCALCFAGPLHAEETVFLLSKTWKIGYTAKNTQQHLIEYVLSGQTVEDWRELVTRQIFTDPNGRIPLDRFVAAVRRGFGSECRNFKWEIVTESESRILYAWSHDGCPGFHAQAERSLVVRAPKGLCRWAYAIKMPRLEPATASKIDADLGRQSCD